MARHDQPPNSPKPADGWTAPDGSAPGYRGTRRRSPFAPMAAAVTAALLTRGRRVRGTLVFGAICVVLLAVIAAIIVGAPKKSTNAAEVTTGTAPVAPAAKAHSVTALAPGSATPSASAPTSQVTASRTPTVTPSASLEPTPTPTPTPTPSPTPRPTPKPPVPTTCAATVSDPTPHHNEVVNVIVQTAPGAHVTVTAHYRTERTTHHTVADAAGQADVPFDVLDAIYGFNVRVVVVASGAGGTVDCSTSYTPTP